MLIPMIRSVLGARCSTVLCPEGRVDGGGFVRHPKEDQSWCCVEVCRTFGRELVLKLGINKWFRNPTFCSPLSSLSTGPPPRGRRCPADVSSHPPLSAFFAPLPPSAPYTRWRVCPPDNLSHPGCQGLRAGGRVGLCVRWWVDGWVAGSGRTTVVGSPCARPHSVIIEAALVPDLAYLTPPCSLPPPATQSRMPPPHITHYSSLSLVRPGAGGLRQAGLAMCVVIVGRPRFPPHTTARI